MKTLDVLFLESGERREKACCAGCGNQINESDFIDELSRTEFKISGLCQSCQDDFFIDTDDICDIPD